MVNITLSVNMPIYGIDDDYECPKESTIKNEKGKEM